MSQPQGGRARGGARGRARKTEEPQRPGPLTPQHAPPQNGRDKARMPGAPPQRVRQSEQVSRFANPHRVFRT